MQDLQEGSLQSTSTIEGDAQRDIEGVAALEIEKALLTSEKGSKRPSLTQEKGSRRASLVAEKGSRRGSLVAEKGSRRESLVAEKENRRGSFAAEKGSRRESLSLAKEKKLSGLQREDRKQVSETDGDKRASSEKIESSSPKSAKDEKSLFGNQESLADAEDAGSVPKSKDESFAEAFGDTSAAELENLDVDLPQPDYTEGANAQSKDDIFAEENVLEEDPAQMQAGDEVEQPIIIEDLPTGQQAATTKSEDDRTSKRNMRYIREGCRISPAEVMYKAAARVIQDPTKPLHRRPCGAYIPGTSVRGAQGGSNRQDTESMRRELLKYHRACSTKWELNPACTVPMRATPYMHRSRVSTAAPVEEWCIWEERDKDRRDHELAVELGYETLVGNLLYIDIPGGNDINRSWQNFLSGDPMEWGFPYEKGSMERPRMKLQEPYLAHQVKEKLWKFPRARTFQTAQEE